MASHVQPSGDDDDNHSLSERQQKVLDSGHQSMESRGYSPSAISKARISWSRLWSIAKVIGPSTVAVAALIISLLTYEDQHQTDVATATSNLRQQAELITFFQSQVTGAVQINNYSNEPASYAELITHVDVGGKTYPISMGIGPIPACSMGTIASSELSYWQSTLSLSGGGTGFENAEAGPVIIVSMYFTDNNGNNWQYLADGPLEASSPPPMLPVDGMHEAIQMPANDGEYEVGDIIPSFLHITRGNSAGNKRFCALTRAVDPLRLTGQGGHPTRIRDRSRGAVCLEVAEPPGPELGEFHEIVLRALHVYKFWSPPEGLFPPGPAHSP